MSSVLDNIIAATRLRVAAARQTTAPAALEKQAAAHTPRGFERALRSVAQHGIAVIAELKKASPSKGMIRPSFHPEALATELVHAGATALSVLTEEQHFQGSLDYLVEVSAAVEVPLLRKDFIVDEFQMVEARAFCADAILLIVAALSDAELRRLYEQARSLELDVLCEVHDDDELTRALDAGCEIIGINNRNLHTFEVDLNTSLRLAERIPEDLLRVAESGISTPHDIATLRGAGFHAFLIGETLMRTARPGETLVQLIQQKPVSH